MFCGNSGTGGWWPMKSSCSSNSQEWADVKRALTVKMERTSVKCILQIDEAKHSKGWGRVGGREGGEGTNQMAGMCEEGEGTVALWHSAVLYFHV